MVNSALASAAEPRRSALRGAPVLFDFRIARPAHEIAQADAARWLASAHAAVEAAGEGPERAEIARRMERLFARYGCDPGRIARRGHAFADLVPREADLGARMALFADAAADALERLYEPGEGAAPAPDDLVHVTCTGYTAPSAAQRLVERRGWARRTTVTHAYHMGCYAAIPALRIATGLVAASRRPRRADVVHTEICTLHLDPAAHEPEQIVVQSLFADGFVRYSAGAAASVAGAPGLLVRALREELIPGTAAAMEWTPAAHGMRMRLAREVPDRIAAELEGFAGRLFADAGLDFAGARRSAAFAIHPGGPRIIERAARALDLAPGQTAASAAVLRDFGNMSSATLPHIWARLLEDPDVAPGTIIASFGFGPGLTIAGAILEKTA